MSNTILSDVKEIPFWKLIKDKNIFLIPNYQRPYAWDSRKQVKDFWEDIYTSFKNNPSCSYLLGNIYLAPVDTISKLKSYVQEDIFNQFFEDIEKVGKDLKDLKENWERVNFHLVIDGQQRITTFFLLIKALKDSLKEDLSGIKLFVTLDGLKELPKLILGSINAQFFQNLINDNKTAPHTLSNKRLSEALNFLETKVNSLSDEERKKFMDFVINHVNIIQSIISSLDHAVILFVSQTDRGKELTYLEKLKSLLSFYVYTKISNNNDKTDILNRIDKIFSESFSLLDSLVENNIFSREKEVEDYYFKIIKIIETLDYDKDLRKARRISSEEAYEDTKAIFRKHTNIENLKESINEYLKIIDEINQLFFYIIRNLHSYSFASVFKLLKPSPQTYAFLTKLHAKFPNLKFEDRRFSWDRDHECLSEYFKEEKKRLEENILTNIRNRDIREFLLGKLKKIEYREENTPISVLNLIELLELAVWKAGKEPVQTFKNAWRKAFNSPSEEGIINAFGFLEEYRCNYLEYYAHFKYIYGEYECEKLEGNISKNPIFTVQEYDKEALKNIILNENISGKLSIEHIFPQEKTVEISRHLHEYGFKDEKEYDTFVTDNKGNWILIRKNLNSKLRNASPLDKGIMYTSFFEKKKGKEDCIIRSVKNLGEDLKYLSFLTKNKPSPAFKYLLEIRYLELTNFLFNRFI